MQSIGADEVIDYSISDFTQSNATLGNAPFERSAAVLAKGGRLLMILASLPDMLKAPWYSLISDKKVIAGPCAERPEYVAQLCELAKTGQFMPVIDRCYPLERIVDAHRYVDQGHKKGSVVVIC
jgi:NADPH:quinone reductase-like Zn-dependent oxidoreductase